jgi:hypothetical protein
MSESEELNIRITGLTQEAVDMLDLFWSCNTQQDLARATRHFDRRQRTLAETLHKLIILAIEDSLLEDCTDFSNSEARQVIDRIKKNVNG